MTTYKEAGVDIEKKKALLKKVGGHVKATFDKRVMSSETLFKSMLVSASELKSYKEPMLAFNADGAGTKTVIAAMMNSWKGIGHDIVNHCINDILTMGAKPLCFSDYIASDKLKPEIVEEIVKGVAECCMMNRIILTGGETAEMPGVYSSGAVDVAGFILGAAEKSRVIDGRNIADGDALIGLASTGLHTNGFSLARKALFEGEGKVYDAQQRFPELKMKLGEALLAPHRNYLKTTLAVMEQHKINGIAHITGGSFGKNIARILPKGLGAEISRGSWQPLPIFRMIQKAGNVAEEEMYRTFNMGIGYVYAVGKADAQGVLQLLRQLKENARVIGWTVKGEGVKFVD